MRRSASLFILALALGGAGACATIPPGAVTTYAPAACGDVDLTRAASLTPPRERAVHEVAAQLGGEGPCATFDGAASPYLLFALPQDRDDKTFTVGATVEQARIAAMTVSLLDAEGLSLRTLPQDDFMFRGVGYSVVFRARPDERYILVSANPAQIGTEHESIAIGVQSSVTATPYGVVATNWGTDEAARRVFSYEGGVTVIVNDSDTDEADAQ